MNAVLNITLFFVFVLILLASFFAINIYVNKSNMPEILVVDSKIPSKDKESKIELPASWARAFAKKEMPDFAYPAQEYAIKLDFSPARVTNIIEISNLDSYKFFCLNEILKSNNIQFSYQKKGDFLNLRVSLLNASVRAKLENELRKYNIKFSIKEQ